MEAIRYHRLYTDDGEIVDREDRILLETLERESYNPISNNCSPFALTNTAHESFMHHTMDCNTVK